MNKVFKVIWSEARNAYVVVSEIAKNHGSKSSSTKKLLAMLIATGVMTCASFDVLAAQPAAETTAAQQYVALKAADFPANIGLMRNGDKAVDDAITVISGGGTGGSGADKDTFVKISNGKTEQTTEQTFATGSKVEAIGTKEATTGIKINGEDYAIKSGSVVSVAQTADKKTTTITVDGTATNITDTDTTYTEGDGIEISGANAIPVSKNLTGMQSITGAGTGAGSISFKGSNVKVNQNTFNSDGRIQGVAAGKDNTDAVNVGQLNKVVDAGDTDVHIKSGEYKVDDKNKVAMNLVDKAGNDEGTVTITGVAKAEDVAVVYDQNKTSLRSTNASVAENAIALGKGASAVKDSVAIGNGASVVAGSNGSSGVALGYKAHAGYKGTSLGSNAISGREGTTLVGANTNSGSLYTTVVGTDSVINNSDGTTYKVSFMGIKKELNVQGATATVVGSKNTVDNKNGKVYSGVANNVMGSANTVEGSNGVTIQGTGNKVTDAYKDMNITTNEGLAILGGDYSVLAKKQSGAVAVVGGANTVSKQTDSTVIGYDNQLIGGEENISHDVFMAGSHNRLNNVSDSIVMGNENAITGVSNVISFGHQNTISADNAVAIGNGAGVIVEGGVALGVGSVASTDAGALGYGAAEGETGIAWKATNGAVSVGSSVEGKKITRQITNVAAGTEDTDAVNVAQLKKVSEAAASASQGWKLKTQNGNASDVKPGATVEFDGDANIQVGNDGNKVSVTLKKQLTGIQSITGEGEGAGSISFANDGIKFNNKVTIDNTGKISGVADGKISTDSTDAVNGSQLHAVATEAGKHTTLSNGKNTTVNPVTTADGHLEYKVNVAGDLTDITSVANGDSKINLNKDSIIISNGNKYFAITNSGIGMSYIGADYSAKSIMLGENGTTISGGLNVAGSKITGVAAGVADTDAVNVGQLNAAVQAGNTDTHIKAGEYGVGADNKVNMDVVDKNGNKVDTVTIKDVAKASDVGNVNNIADDIKNGEGHTTVVDAVNNLNNKVGDLQYSKVEKGDIADGDSTTTAIGKLDQKLTDVAATAAKHTKVEGSSNITVTNTAKEGEAANYKVELNKDIDVDTVTANSVTTGQTVMNNDGLKVGENVSVTGTAVTAGQASISNEGLAVGPNTSLKADELKVDGKNYIDKDGLNANGQHITNVKAGEADTDAVNYGQLKDTNNHIDRVENQVVNNTNRISNLDNRVNKVGAGAAALAALHPLDFDPDAKWDFAAGYGNYRGANAAAVGAYYRPNEDTMFSVGGTFGNGENMVNVGVSFKLGSGSSHVSTSRVAMAKEIKELRGELEAMKSAMLDANAGKKIDTSKLQLFPDVPQNHWAYEYVAQLAGDSMIEGYPDGNFAGDRPMTRYEFAAILYRAMTKGAVLSDKILSEFSHELEYFTVDTIAKDKAGNPTIQRVRIVKENKNK